MSIEVAQGRNDRLVHKKSRISTSPINQQETIKDGAKSDRLISSHDASIHSKVPKDQAKKRKRNTEEQNSRHFEQFL